MRPRARAGAKLLALAIVLARPADAQILDSFEDIGAWQAVPASGVEMHLSSAPGRTGNALQVSFDFHGGGGWAALHKAIPLHLPENYEISFWLKGDAPRNTLEFKLIDASGENVWWVNRPDFEYAGEWRKITFRKRHVSFAWGPAGGGEIRDAGAIEVAITAGTGGKGTIWLDDLTLTPREVIKPYDATPVVRTSGKTYDVDFTRSREFGGIIVDWRGRPSTSRSYDVQLSSDGRQWQTVRQVRGSSRAHDYLQLPESEARYVRLLLPLASVARQVARLRVMPLAWGNSRNAMFETIAAENPRGLYPKYFNKVQSYWTVVGLPNDSVEALINEEGAIEFGARSFSLEPFLYANSRLITWASTTNQQDLMHWHGSLVPIPIVTRTADSLELTINLSAQPQASTRAFVVKYAVHNRSRAPRTVKLYLAARPFQVNPSSQFLNISGGATTIGRIDARNPGAVRIQDKVVRLSGSPRVGVATFDDGDIAGYIVRDALPSRRDATDPNGLSSAGWGYTWTLPAGKSATVDLVVADTNAVARDLVPDVAATAAKWDALLSSVRITIPDGRIMESIRSNLAYILINADGPAIQPGSRSYARSWIRDGSLTSAALLRLNQGEAVKRFIESYAPFQYADGKVPCCVDHRGADPVPENDSHGELIYLITDYFRYTRDTVTARLMYPHVVRAVAYLDSLRHSRRTEQYRGTGFWGMLPQSISHEGYSAKAMHSYWDDFFALTGFKNAVRLAEALGDSARAAQWRASRDEFQADLISSFEWTMRERNIDWLAGAVELGDFDATSTTVGINPAHAERVLPQAALRRTFDKYWQQFVARRDSNHWDAYTPYEWRVVGSFVRLGQRQRAHALLEWFMQHQRPGAWRQWSEVVYRDSAAQHFIGDMPHTWVGSDFIRSVLDMFAYDDDDRLVIGAGIVPEWLATEQPIAVENLNTPYGAIAYTITHHGNDIRFEFLRRPEAPPQGFVVRSPLEQNVRSARADNVNVAVQDNDVHLPSLPRTLVLSY